MIFIIYIIGYIVAYIFLKLAKIGNNTWGGVFIRFLASFLSWIVPLTFIFAYIVNLPIWKKKPPINWL